MGCLTEDIEMASRGWNLWDGIISRHPDRGETCYCVFFDQDRITLKALELFTFFRRKKSFRKAVVITDIEMMHNIVKMDETVTIELLPVHDLECLLKYYSLHKFSNNFYVLSLDKFEQCCLKSVADELSLEEIILLGLYRLSSTR